MARKPRSTTAQVDAPVEAKKVEPTFSNLNNLMTETEKRYGGKVITAGDEAIPYARLPTGVFQMDVALFGGWPDGFTCLVAGWEGSAKSTTCIKTVREAQEKYPDLKAVYVDAETHYDRDWFELNGVDTSKLIVIQNLEFGEAYADAVHSVLRTGEVSLVVLDSIPALIPMDSMDKSAEDNVKVAGRAAIVNRIYSSAITARQMLVKAGKKAPTFIMVNQFRDAVGTFSPYGTPTTMPGGHSQKYLSALTVTVNKPKITEISDPETGFKGRLNSEFGFKFTKPKGGSAFLSGTFNLVQSNLHPRCNEGDLDDVATVMAYAKSLGMTGGGGKKQTFIMYPNDTFEPKDGIKAAAFMATKLWEDKPTYRLTKAVIIAMVRMRHNKPMMPYDDYIYGYTQADILPIVERIINFRETGEME